MKIWVKDEGFNGSECHKNLVLRKPGGVVANFIEISIENSIFGICLDIEVDYYVQYNSAMVCVPTCKQ